MSLQGSQRSQRLSALDSHRTVAAGPCLATFDADTDRLEATAARGGWIALAGTPIGSGLAAG